MGGTQTPMTQKRARKEVAKGAPAKKLRRYALVATVEREYEHDGTAQSGLAFAKRMMDVLNKDLEEIQAKHQSTRPRVAWEVRFGEQWEREEG